MVAPDDRPDDGPPSVPPPRTRRAWRVAAWSIGGLVVALVALVVVGWWVLGRETTLQRIVVEAEKTLPGQLTVDGVTGSIYDRVAFERLVFRSRTQVFTVERGSLRYRLEPLAHRFTIVDARAAKLTIETIAKSDEPTTEPDTLELPAAARLDTLAIDAVHLDAIELVDADRHTTLSNAELRGRYATEGGRKRWTVERIGVTTPWGRADGRATLDATRPFAIDARIEASGAFDDGPRRVPYRAPLVATGRLGDLALSSDFTVSDPSNAPLAGHADARVLPFRDQPIDHANLHVAGLAPKRWNADLPEAEVTIDAAIVPQPTVPGGAADPFAGRVRLVNARPGPIDRGRIPVASLDATVTGDALGVAVSGLAADLGAAGRLTGAADYRFASGAASLDGVVRALDLRAVHGKLVASKFDGPLAVSRTDGVLRIATRLADAGRDVRIDASMRGDAIRIAEADVRLGGSHATASGSIDLGRNRPFDVAGTLAHLNPRDFGDFQRADLNGAFKLAGTLGAATTARGAKTSAQLFEIAADLRIDPSRVVDRPLAGTVVGRVAGTLVPDPPKGRAPVTIRSIDGAHVALAVGADRIALDGDFGRPRDRLAWKLDAPKLADLATGLSGSLAGSGAIGGTLSEPTIDFDVAGDDLRYAKAPAAAPATPTTTATATNAAASTVAAATTAYSVKTLRGNGHLLAGGAGRLTADVALTDFRDGAAGTAPTVRSAAVRVDGTRDAHRIAVTAASDRFDFSAEGQGGLDATDTWRGAIEKLVSRGRVPFALAQSTTLVAGADRVELGAAQLRFDTGRVDLERLVYEGGRLDTAGRATGFPLSIVGTFSRDFAQRVSTSLTFGAAWNLKVGDAIDGTFRVFRESGNVRFLTEPRFAVDPEKVEVSATVVADRVTARIAADGRGLGHIDASIETRLSKRDGQWGLAGDAPLAMKSDVDIPDLRWLARLSGVPGLDVYGSLKAAVTGQGTVGRPVLAGHATGDAIGLRWPDQGLNARDGHLDFDFQGDRVLLKQATLTAGNGRLEASGDLKLDDRAVNGTLNVKFDKFEAVSRSDRTMVVSGSGALRFGPTGVDVTADVKADRGALQLAERRGPTLSTDIVIVGRETDDTEAAPKSVPVRFEVKFDMGDDFKVKGAGFDGKLGGTIRISGVGTDLRAIGAVEVREGTYEGYGQRLTIVRGVLVFSGPIDNPALDINAVRKNLAVEAGVQISGTALAPQAKLISTPNVPDTEKVSWLVLGHGLTASNKSDYALLTSAAASLFGSSDSASLQSRIAATLGVDEIGVSGLGGTTGGLLTVGKQISSRLRVSFEQGFLHAATLIKLRYNIYKQIDLQVQAGTESAVDIFYTFQFD